MMDSELELYLRNYINDSPMSTPPLADLSLYSVSPSSTVAGSSDTLVALSGSGFDPSVQAYWNSTPLLTTYLDANNASAVIPASLLVTVATSNIYVTVGTSTSNTVSFSVTTPVIPHIAYANSSFTWLPSTGIATYGHTIGSGHCLLLAIAARGPNNAEFVPSVSATNGVTFTQLVASPVMDCINGETERYSQLFFFVATNCPATDTTITVTFGESGAQSILELGHDVYFFLELANAATTSILEDSANAFAVGATPSLSCGPMTPTTTNTMAVLLFADWFYDFGRGSTLNTGVPQPVLMQVNQSDVYILRLIIDPLSSTDPYTFTASDIFISAPEMSMLSVILKGV